MKVRSGSNRKDSDHERKTIQHRREGPHFAGSGCGQERGGSLPGEEHLGRDLPPLAVAIWPSGPQRGEAAEGVGEGKHRAEEDAGRGDAGEEGLGVRTRKKIVSPGHKKAVAQAVVSDGLCSGRKACQILHLARSTLWYRAGQRSDRQQQMIIRMHALSEAHPRYGYRRIAALLRQEGWQTGKRQVQRLRRLEGLRVPPTKRKIIRRGVSTGLPTTARTDSCAHSIASMT